MSHEQSSSKTLPQGRPQVHEEEVVTMPKRTIGAILVLLVVSSSLSSGTAVAAAPRVETGRYDAPGGVAGVIGGSVSGTRIGSVDLQGGPERFVSIEITDLTGQPVAADVVQFVGDSNVSTEEDDTLRHSICGATKKPLRIRRFVEVRVFIYAGPCEDGTPAAATTGEVTATFKNRAPKV